MDVSEQARNERLKLRFSKPQGWQFQESEDETVLFELVEHSATPFLSEIPTITLVVRSSLGKPLDDFVEVVTDGIEITHPGSKVLSQQSRQLLKYPARQRTFTFPSEERPMMLALITAVDGDIAYLLFYTAQESEFFEKGSAFEQVVQSLHFETENGLDPLIRHQILTQEYLQARDR